MGAGGALWTLIPTNLMLRLGDGLLIICINSCFTSYYGLDTVLVRGNIQGSGNHESQL